MLQIFRQSGSINPGSSTVGSYDAYIALALPAGQRLRLISGRNYSASHRLINLYLGSSRYKTNPDLWANVPDGENFPVTSGMQLGQEHWVMWIGDIIIPESYPIAIMRCVTSLGDGDSLDLLVGVEA